MRKIDPTFDLYELEDDAKGIFEAAYTTYLNGKLDLLEKMCGEMALGYFKVLLRKMEAEKCEPKYKYLWQIDPASFSTALIPEKKLPVFIFIIKTQEIYCNISKVDKRIVDGDDERLMNWEYQFAITPHSNPDLENVGHAWEIIELQPRQVLKMLV
jgi:import inner membrane translocase subunit TIM44